MLFLLDIEPDTEEPEMKAALKASLIAAEKKSAEDTGGAEKRQRLK